MSKSGKILIPAAVVIIVAIVFYVMSTDRSRNAADQGKPTITVSIAPVKYLVDRITGGQFAVNVLLPAGSGPETYEPTPRQLKGLESSPVIFITGLLDFENSVASKVAASGTQVIRLDRGIEPIEESCNTHHHGDNHNHPHADPHIWASLSCLRTMAANVLEGLPADYSRPEFHDNYYRLIADIDALDAELAGMLSESGSTAFLIYHPALSYYARDYGLEQIQLEQDGKEPSAEKMIATISKARELGLDKVLYQKEFSIKAVETTARDIGATPVEIDPLAEDILGNLKQITRLIVEQ